MATKAVFIDALGTMLWLQPPWEHVDPDVVAGVDPKRVKDGFIAEIGYYMEHIDEGSDEEGLGDLRRRCAQVLSAEAGIEIPVEAMLGALRFELFAETLPALRELRSTGLPVVCVSNWDCSLPQVLELLGLAPLLDGVVNSASAGVRKPNPAIFTPALALAGCEPREALHVGDSADDVRGAGAAGIPVLRIDRSGSGDIASLLEIRQHLALDER